jgi:preprotein translocase subunit SecE
VVGGSSPSRPAIKFSYYAFRKSDMFQKIARFFNDVQTELSKVSWPTREELINSTMIVAVVSILFTIYIFAADYILAWIMRLFI